MGPRTYWLETYGCQMNQAESEAAELQLNESGFRPARAPAEADVVILYTCSVRATAEERVWGRLGYYRYLKRQKLFTLVVVGCMSERWKGEMARRFPEIDLVVGNFGKRSIVEAIARAPAAGPRILVPTDAYVFAPLHSTGGVRAFVPIMHGCDKLCSYCVVPYVRGREVCRDPESIIAEVHELDRGGAREVTLLGQNVNSYRYHANGSEVDFPALLSMVEQEARGIEWVRFLTSHPKDMSDRLIEVMAGSRRLCRHVHLPVQHGSDRILELMQRGYTSAQYLALVDQIRKALCNVAITTDILIGFPGETARDFEDTLALMRTVRFDDAYTYRYNPREGTPAYGMPGEVPDSVKSERLTQVIELQRAITRENATRRLGEKVRVLVEGTSKKSNGELRARTEWDSMVVFPSDRPTAGTFASVRLVSLEGNTFRAELDEPAS